MDHTQLVRGGDADGRPFLTMEYVDGEDLASLLKRIGRFPQEKAVEVARQICAGVAAAHARGVLHRDLKPANVMIDGEGHVRITDFGLAGAAGSTDNVRSGTPAYMAPEQLAGREVTARSDIYALGLVLFELFTGKRVFEASSLRELIELHESSAPATPSSLVRDLDPAIERVILRCLDREPARRPPSALAVASALPGGDQLAAALAAGETPSPEMVAASGETSALRADIGLAAIAWVVVGLIGLTAMADRVLLIHRMPIPKSADGLRDRAREVMARVGYPEPPADETSGWLITPTFISYVARTDTSHDRWTVLANSRAPSLGFWYRTSPREIVPIGRGNIAAIDDPPTQTPGMRTLTLDAEGHLTTFRAVPPPRRPDSASAAVDWSPLFEAAALPMSAFRPATPKVVPPTFVDASAAFEGVMPGLERQVRVEVAAYAGKPVLFAIIGPWNEPSAVGASGPAPLSWLFTAGSAIVATLVFVGALLLARRHLRSGRGDRRGAIRVGAVVFASILLASVIAARHSANVTLEYRTLATLMATALGSAAGLWLTYLALEPYVRKFWPQLLVGWTRLFAGRFRDPIVGRELLVGVAAGVFISLFVLSHALVAAAIWVPPVPEFSALAPLAGVWPTLAVLVNNVQRAVFSPFQIVFVVVVLKALVRRTWLVAALASIIIFPIAINGTFSGEHLALDIPYTIVGILLVVGVLLRFGMLALSSTFLVFMTLVELPLTADFTRPYAAISTWLLLGTVALAAFGFYAARADEPLFGRIFAE